MHATTLRRDHREIAVRRCACASHRRLIECATTVELMNRRTLIVVPTYQESANIDELLRRVRHAAPDADVLVVDDRSPDGTADLADAVAAELGHIAVLRRRREERPRRGVPRRVRVGSRAWLRRAGRDGRRPVARSVRDPEPAAGDPRRRRPRDRLPLRPRRSHAELAGTAARCSPAPGTCTQGGCSALRTTDATSGYRAYRATALDAIDVDTTHATGYGFQIELAYQRHAGWRADLRGPDRVPRPNAWNVEDVDAHRDRGARARHVVGVPRPCARMAPCSSFGHRGTRRRRRPPECALPRRRPGRVGTPAVVAVAACGRRSRSSATGASVGRDDAATHGSGPDRDDDGHVRRHEPLDAGDSDRARRRQAGARHDDPVPARCHESRCRSSCSRTGSTAIPTSSTT